MTKMEDRVREISEDPVKRGRAFTAMWAVSYGVLLLGVIIIVVVLAWTYLL